MPLDSLTPEAHGSAPVRWPAANGAGSAWLLAQTRPNQLARAESNLRRQGYRCLIPRTETTRRVGQRLVTQVAPLFPGYAFVEVREGQAWSPINGTYGVQGLVMRAGQIPQPVPSGVIGDLLERTDAEGRIWPRQALAAGDRVRITRGAMTGFVAQVEDMHCTNRIGVLLEVMGRAVRARLPSAHVLRLAD